MSGNTNVNPFVPLGVIADAHGIKGAVKLRPFTHSPDAILTYALHDESGKVFTLKAIGVAKDQIICSVEGVSSRNDAEALKGTVLGVHRSAMPQSDADDEFYIEDMVGLRVQLEGGAAYGHVTSVMNYGAGDIIAIQTEQGSEELYSFTHATFPQVDMAARVLTLCPPEILSTEKTS